LAPLGTFEGKVPEAAMAMVAEKEAAIKAGTFTVEINDEEPKSS
jgi:basic membrane protein A